MFLFHDFDAAFQGRLDLIRILDGTLAIKPETPCQHGEICVRLSFPPYRQIPRGVKTTFSGLLRLKTKNVSLFFPLPEIASFAVEELRSLVEGYIIRCLFVVGA